MGLFLDPNAVLLTFKDHRGVFQRRFKKNENGGISQRIDKKVFMVVLQLVFLTYK
jgi:hypothetical protein